jgi:hypothetical protein
MLPLYEKRSIQFRLLPKKSLSSQGFYSLIEVFLGKAIEDKKEGFLA